MKQAKKSLLLGAGLLLLFAVWTLLICTVDVQVLGQTERDVGFATLNGWLHERIGVHLWLYTLTDWLGLVPVGICCFFGMLGFVQLLKRKRLGRVDRDLLLLGVYYGLVIFGYLIFEMLPINYRPILIQGRIEASYPSSTTLLTLSVMPTLPFQAKRRLQNPRQIRPIGSLTALFSAFMVLGRLLSGVHWFTDIVGAVLLSKGLFRLYRAAVLWNEET